MKWNSYGGKQKSEPREGGGGVLRMRKEISDGLKRTPLAKEKGGGDQPAAALCEHFTNPKLPASLC